MLVVRMCPRLADGPQLCDDCVDNVNERRVRAVLALTKCFLSFEKVIAELCSSRIRIALFLPACNHEGPTLRDEMCNSGTTGPRAKPRLARSVIAAAGNPGRKHRHIVRIEGHQIGAISGDELAEHVFETDECRRIGRRKTQRIRQGHAQQANAVLDGGRHVKNGPGERPVVGERNCHPGP